MTDRCVHVACDRPQRARTLCEMHYGQLKRSGLGPLQRRMPRQATGLRLDCQLGRNTSCVDCGDSPYGGGMRCLACFQRQCDVRRQSEPQHECLKHVPSGHCYKNCACRCWECRSWGADDQRKRRARERSA